MVSLRNVTNWLSEFITASSSKYVTPDTAIQYPSIWNAVNKIAGHVGQLPMTLHRRLPNGRGAEPATWHPAYRLMKVRPNGWMNPCAFKELLQTHALLWGNAYAFIREEGGRPVELIPLYPGRTAPELVDGDKQFIHLPVNQDEAILKWRKKGEGGYMVFAEREILHIAGLGFDGYAGKSLWKVASDSWAIGLSSDNRIKHGFEKGFKAAMLLEAPEGALTKEDQAKEFIDNFNKYHSGSENADRVGLLRHGIKANVMNMNSQEAQMVEHRRFQRQDTALWFLLESILGDDSSVSYNSLEQKNLAYLSNCLMRWLVKWEEECNAKLLATNSDRYFFKFNVAALLRADHKTTIETLSLGINSRIYSPNEARQKLDMNPYEGGDSYENPAITPGEPGSTSDSDESTEQESMDDEQNAALRSRMMHLMKIECQRVMQCCSKPNFIEAVDRFYDRWQGTLEKALEECGGVPAAAEDHCDESKAILLQLAVDYVDEELKAEVASAIESWSDRVGGLCRIAEPVGA